MISFYKFGKLGRFGNQLFQYAGVRLYAQAHGFRFALPEWIGTQIFEQVQPETQWERIKTFFNTIIQLDDLRTYAKRDVLPWLLSRNRSLPHLTFLKDLYAQKRDNINIYGYMQDDFSLGLLWQHREEVKKWFTFKKEITEEFNKTTKHHGPWIGLHIRKGDFMKIGVALPIEEYRKALEVIKKEYPSHKIFIATNDPTIYNDFQEYNVLALTNPIPRLPDYIFDFWMLSRAEVIISGGSTFSWWAAFLGKKDYYSAPLTHTWSKDAPPEILKRPLV